MHGIGTKKKKLFNSLICDDATENVDKNFSASYGHVEKH
jgi:hypothetical protein